MNEKKFVFLGGTRNESRWRDLLIPQLDCAYFNPVVADWTPACHEIEIQKRKDAALCVCVLTPKMAGVYAVAEAVEDAIARPDQTLVMAVREDRGDVARIVFDAPQWKSLLAVGGLIERRGAAFRTANDLAFGMKVLAKEIEKRMR